MVSGAGQHQFKGGFGYSRADQRRRARVSEQGLRHASSGTPAFTSDVPGVGSGTGTYGYYTIDDIGTKGETGANILSLFVQDNWTVTPRLTLNLGIRTEKRGHPVVPSRHPGSRHPLRLG